VFLGMFKLRIGLAENLIAREVRLEGASVSRVLVL
jgi:hypothetical protein